MADGRQRKVLHESEIVFLNVREADAVVVSFFQLDLLKLHLMIKHQNLSCNRL